MRVCMFSHSMQNQLTSVGGENKSFPLIYDVSKLIWVTCFFSFSHNTMFLPIFRLIYPFLSLSHTCGSPQSFKSKYIKYIRGLRLRTEGHEGTVLNSRSLFLFGRNCNVCRRLNLGIEPRTLGKITEFRKVIFS